MLDEITRLRERERQEREAAASAATPQARQAHLELAAMYAERIERSGKARPLLTQLFKGKK